MSDESNPWVPTYIWVDSPRHGAASNIYVETEAPNSKAVRYVLASELTAMQEAVSHLDDRDVREVYDRISGTYVEPT